MAETTSAAALAAPLPTSDEIDRAAAFVREPFVLEGEDAQSALASGTPRRRALDAALAETAAGHDSPSVEWRRDFSLMLGLERVLSEDEPKLVDGTVLSAHQVDALSGTLTALLAEAQRTGNGNGSSNGNGGANGAVAEAELPLASVGIPGEEDVDDDDEPDEPQDWDEAGAVGDDGAGDEGAGGAPGLGRGGRRRRRRAAPGGAGGPQRRQALLVRARDGR